MVNVFPNIDTAVKHEGEAATTILQGVLWYLGGLVLLLESLQGSTLMHEEEHCCKLSVIIHLHQAQDHISLLV